MPKTLIVCHVALLACLSFLVFPFAAATFADVPTQVPADPVVEFVAIAAAVLGSVMAVTEVFSGLRWLALAAAAGGLVGLASLLGHLPPISPWAWAIAWIAVALWFAVLAAQQRRDR